MLRNLWYGPNISWAHSYADLEGGHGLQTPPWKIIRKIGFLSNTSNQCFEAILVRIPWKNAKLLSQQCWAIIVTPAKCHLCSACLFQTSLCSKQCGPRLNCSPKSSLIQVHNVCLYEEISHWRKLHFPYIMTHMSSTSWLLKDILVAINVDPDLIGAVWSGS